jgi:hypothetical protein
MEIRFPKQFPGSIQMAFSKLSFAFLEEVPCLRLGGALVHYSPLRLIKRQSLGQFFQNSKACL